MVSLARYKDSTFSQSHFPYSDLGMKIIQLDLM